MNQKKFIIWDPKDGDPRRNDSGEFISDGIIGRVGIHNAYMEIYAEFPEDAKPLKDLEVGEAVRNVKYSLSGTSGIYDIYRVA